MELEFSAALLQLVRSGRSTEPEVSIWYICTAAEVEQLGSTVVQYLMEQVFIATLLLECTLQTLVSVI